MTSKSEHYPPHNWGCFEKYQFLTKDSYMIKVVAKFTIKAENVEEFKKTSTELIDKTRKETGCITYELFQDFTDSNILAFIEEWDNVEALTKHTKTEHFIRIVPQLEMLKDKATEMNIYNLIS